MFTLVDTHGLARGYLREYEQTQADFAEQIYRLSFGHAAVASINKWGLSERRIRLPVRGHIANLIIIPLNPDFEDR